MDEWLSFSDRRAAGEVTSGREICDCEYQAVKGAAGRLDYWTGCVIERHNKLLIHSDTSNVPTNNAIDMNEVSFDRPCDYDASMTLSRHRARARLGGGPRRPGVYLATAVCQRAVIGAKRKLSSIFSDLPDLPTKPAAANFKWGINPMRMIDMSMEQRRNEENVRSPRKPLRTTASSGTIPTCENPEHSRFRFTRSFWATSRTGPGLKSVLEMGQPAGAGRPGPAPRIEGQAQACQMAVTSPLNNTGPHITLHLAAAPPPPSITFFLSTHPLARSCVGLPSVVDLRPPALSIVALDSVTKENGIYGVYSTYEFLMTRATSVSHIHSEASFVKKKKQDSKHSATQPVEALRRPDRVYRIVYITHAKVVYGRPPSAKTGAGRSANREYLACVAEAMLFWRVAYSRPQHTPAQFSEVWLSATQCQQQAAPSRCPPLYLTRSASKIWGGGMWAALSSEVLIADEGETRRVWSRAGMKVRGKLEIPEETCQPAASSGTISTCENQWWATPPGIEPGSPWWGVMDQQRTSCVFVDVSPNKIVYVTSSQLGPLPGAWDVVRPAAAIKRSVSSAEARVAIDRPAVARGSRRADPPTLHVGLPYSPPAASYSANLSAAEKKSRSRRVMERVHFERETTAIGTRSKLVFSAGLWVSVRAARECVGTRSAVWSRGGMLRGVAMETAGAVPGVASQPVAGLSSRLAGLAIDAPFLREGEEWCLALPPRLPGWPGETVSATARAAVSAWMTPV
ncbi:hypothetical protein PR048_030674 [Dryococelus australis]|uniref:Uncharacterized protein n=1 Tax=Dryococelus australis TaxID=614101 RepID=A0ABQ9G9K3_9NEOP|nr:hypothetical protein PR048_030674 [Dryococelus australis]